jgi:preprotein translocase subunit SecD
MKRAIQLLSVCLLSLSAVAADPSSTSVFQMRLVASKPSADSQGMVYVDKITGKKETLYVLKKVLIDQTGVKSVVVPKVDQPQVNIKLTDEARKRLAEVTRENIGKRLATVVAGRVYSAPKIMSEISIGEVVIAVSSEKEAKALVAQITDSMKKQ